MWYQPMIQRKLFFGRILPSLVPRLFIGETIRQLTQLQTVYEYDIKKITAALVQAMNIG